MNENDKILICSYLDGELNSEDQKYIEELIESSSEANDYANAIKRSKNEMDAFFNSEEVQNLSKRIDKFIDKKKSKKSLNLFNLKLFNNKNYYGGAVGFILMGIIIFPLIFEEEIINININTERDAYFKNGSLDIEKILSDSIAKIDVEKINKANVIIGNEQILIVIDEKINNCVSGEFIYENLKKQFISCRSNDSYEIKIN